MNPRWTTWDWRNEDAKEQDTHRTGEAALQDAPPIPRRAGIRVPRHREVRPAHQPLAEPVVRIAGTLEVHPVPGKKEAGGEMNDPVVFPLDPIYGKESI